MATYTEVVDGQETKVFVPEVLTEETAQSVLTALRNVAVAIEDLDDSVESAEWGFIRTFLDERLVKITNMVRGRFDKLVDEFGDDLDSPVARIRRPNPNAGRKPKAKKDIFSLG